MSGIKGWPSQTKLDRVKSEFATVEPVGNDQQGLTVVSRGFSQKIGADDAVEAGSTVNIITATGHTILKGDTISFTSGALDTIEVRVSEVIDTDNVRLTEDLPSAPAPGDTFAILRNKQPVVSASGGISTSPGPVQFLRNGVTTTVEAEVGGDANDNVGLPVVLTGMDGAKITIDNAQLQVDLDASNDSVECIQDTRTDLLTNSSLQLQGVDVTLTNGVPIVNQTGDTIDITALSSTSSSIEVLQDTRADLVTNSSLQLQGVDVTLTNGVPIVNQTGDTLDITALSSTSSSIEVLQDTRADLVANASVQLQGVDITLTNGMPIVNQTGDTLDITALSSTSSSIEVLQDTRADLVTNASVQVQGVDVTDAAPLPIKLGNGVEIVDAGMDIVDLLDTPVLLTSVTTINGSAGALVDVVASLAADCKKIKINDTTGEFIGVYDDTVLKCVIGPGEDGMIDCQMASGSVVALRSMGTSAITNAGDLCIQFIG